MKTILLAAIVAFVVTAVIGKPVIRWLQKQKFGQKILEIGPKWHMNKQYTPTMGGFMFMIGITVAMLVTAIALGVFTGGSVGVGSFFSVWLLAVAYGCVGFVDDWAKIKKKEERWPDAQAEAAFADRGRSGLCVAPASGRRSADGRERRRVPAHSGYRHHADPAVDCLSDLAVFAIVAENNAVNLTDGIDGLAAGVTLPVAVFFMALNYRADIYTVGNLGAAVFAGALIGALCAFPHL